MWQQIQKYSVRYACLYAWSVFENAYDQLLLFQSNAKENVKITLSKWIWIQFLFKTSSKRMELIPTKPKIE